MVEFELAKTTDAKTCATIVYNSYKVTYGKYMSLDYIEREYSIEHFEQVFGGFISQNGFEVYLINKDDKHIGVLCFGKPDLEDLYKSDMDGFGEIHSIHILHEACGTGIGTKAIRFAERKMLEMGFKKSFLWVKKQNTNAIKFYTTNGYKKTMYTCDNPSDGVPSFVMEKVKI